MLEVFVYSNAQNTLYLLNFTLAMTDEQNNRIQLQDNSDQEPSMSDSTEQTQAQGREQEAQAQAQQKGDGSECCPRSRDTAKD